MIDIIAEIGSSPAPHWNLDMWCGAACYVGATHIKAQMFLAEHFPREEWESKRPLEFPRERLGEFVDVAHALGLKAGVSVFDEAAVKLAARGCDFIKLAAREQNNRILREDCFNLRLNKTIYRSVSNLTMGDLSIMPNMVTLFAVQRYPTPMAIAIWNLFRWSRLAKSERMCWGWSSHTRGTLDCVLAARLGARAIEKHLVLGYNDLEAGHALRMVEFKKMTRRIQKGDHHD